jgi:hypothetical protein
MRYWETRFRSFGRCSVPAIAVIIGRRRRACKRIHDLLEKRALHD